MSGVGDTVLNRTRVVLVRPRIAANLGATARVMRNMGLTELVLVAPAADPADRNARQLSTHGEAILDHCRIVADLAEAVADCVLVVGTSARLGGLFRKQSLGTPDEIMPHVIGRLSAGPVALVFGPEPTGLENIEVSRCHYLIHIPTDAAYPALNLAQSAAITLYELRRHWLRQTQPLSAPLEPAPFAAQERMFDQLRDALEGVHFLFGDKADSLMHAVRHLIGRAGPTMLEVDILFGLARQLRWIAEQAKRPGCEEPSTE
jgi:tRNA/rRNA methyltransferase